MRQIGQVQKAAYARRKYNRDKPIFTDGGARLDDFVCPETESIAFTHCNRSRVRVHAGFRVVHIGYLDWVGGHE